MCKFSHHGHVRSAQCLLAPRIVQCVASSYQLEPPIIRGGTIGISKAEYSLSEAAKTVTFPTAEIIAKSLFWE